MEWFLDVFSFEGRASRISGQEKLGGRHSFVFGVTKS